jgi:hypothetical protein
VELLLALGVILLLRLFFRNRGSNGAGSGDAGAGGSTVSQNDGYGPIDDITEGWAQIEGFYKPGSVAQRYNNPGNVKGDYPGVVGHTPSGIDIFGDVGDGWDAATSWVQSNEQQHPGWSFSQLFAKVLGSLSGTPVNNDQGNSQAEAEYVASYLGVPADSSVTDYTGDD